MHFWSQSQLFFSRFKWTSGLLPIQRAKTRMSIQVNSLYIKKPITAVGDYTSVLFTSSGAQQCANFRIDVMYNPTDETVTLPSGIIWHVVIVPNGMSVSTVSRTDNNTSYAPTGDIVMSGILNQSSTETRYAKQCVDLTNGDAIYLIFTNDVPTIARIDGLITFLSQ